VNSKCENCECKTVNTVHWFDTSCSVIPVNNAITLISTVQSQVGYIFCRWKYMRSSENFRTVFSESQNTNPLDAELGLDFNAKWPFEVICFGVNEEPLRGYIVLVQYNNCGLECEGSEDIASERSENRHLRRPHSHLTPPLANPREYPHKSYLARN